jgi:Rrf2 family protein
MFFTKECDYAIRMLRSLADFETKSVGAICEREYIPLQFAYKILKKLDHADIVRAHRGTLGGYQLAKNLDRITLYDIINAVDEDLFLSVCQQPGYACPQHTEEKYCKTRQEMERIQDILFSALKEKTMDMLI